jgi:hypothetical protein
VLATPLPAALDRRGNGRLLHRARRQRAGARLRLFRGRGGTESGGLFAQNDAGMRVHVMYLMTYRTSHRLIDVAVSRGIFGNKALNAVSGGRAPIYKERHAGIAQRRGAGGRDLNRVVRLGQDRPPRTPVCHP